MSRQSKQLTKVKKPSPFLGTLLACLLLLICSDAHATFTQDRHQAHGPAGACGSYENGWPTVYTLHNLSPTNTVNVNGMKDRYGNTVTDNVNVGSLAQVQQLTNQSFPFFADDGYVAFNPYGSPDVRCPSPQRSGGDAYRDYHQDRVHEMYGQEVSDPGDNGSTFFDPRITVGMRACVGAPLFYPDVPSNPLSALECLVRFPPPHMYPVVIPGAWTTGSNLMWPLHSCWKWACGGGMVNSSSSLTINECTFVGNLVRFCARLAEPGVKNVNDYKGNAHAENYNSLANRTAIDPDYRGPGKGNRFAGPLVRAGNVLVDTKVAVEINSSKGSEPKYLVLVNGVVTEGATATIQGKFGVEKTVTADPIASQKYRPGGEAYNGAERAEVELKNTHQQRLSSGGSQEVHDELILYRGRVVNPRTQLCAYEDPGDGMDMAGGDQPSHHNRPNPKKTSLQNMGESLVGMANNGTGQALPDNAFFNDLSGVLFKASEKVIGSMFGVFTLIDAITSKLNHVVMQDEGCVDLPIGPYPPIPTKSISTPGYFPSLQPICQFGENPNGLKKSSADPSQYVVDSKNIRNICACPGNAVSPDGFCTESDPTKYNTFEIPKVLAGFNNVIPYCLEGQNSKDDELCACNPGRASTTEAPCEAQQPGDRIAYRLGIIGTGAKVDVPLSFCRAEVLATTGDQCACTATRTTNCQQQNQNMSYCRPPQLSTETVPCSTSPTICQAGAAPQRACVVQTEVCNPTPNCASCDQTMIDANKANNGTGAGSPGCDAKCGTCMVTCSSVGESGCTEICSITGPSTTCSNYCAAGSTPTAPTCTPVCGETADPKDGSLCIQSVALASPETSPRTVKACTPGDDPAVTPCACRPAPDPQVPGCTPLTSGPPLAACVDAAPAQDSTSDAPCSCTPGRTTGCQVPAAGEQFAYRIKEEVNVMGHKAIGIIKGNGGANFKEVSYSFNFIAPNMSAPANAAVVINGLKDIPTTTPGSPAPLAPKPDKQYFITMDDPTKVCLYEKAKNAAGGDLATNYCSARPDSIYDTSTKCAPPAKLNPIVSSCVARVATPPLTVTTLPDCTAVASFLNTQPDENCSSHYYPLMRISLGNPAVAPVHTALVGAKDNNKCARLHGIEFCTGVTGDPLKYTLSVDPNVKPSYAGGLEIGKFEPSSPEKDGYLRGAKRMCVGRLGKMLVKPIITKIVTTVRPRLTPQELKQFTVEETRKSLDAYDLEKATGQPQSAISIKTITTTEISAANLADPALKANDLIYLNVTSSLKFTEAYPTTLPVTGQTNSGDTTVKVEIRPEDLSDPAKPILQAIVTTTTKTVDGNMVSETITTMEKKDKDNVTQISRTNAPFPEEMPKSGETNSYEPDLREEALPGSILMASYTEGDKIIYPGRIPKLNEDKVPAEPFPDNMINQDREIVTDESNPPVLVHPETSQIKKCIEVPDPLCPVSYSRMTVGNGETALWRWPETKVGETVTYSGGKKGEDNDNSEVLIWTYANNKCLPDGTWQGTHTDVHAIDEGDYNGAIGCDLGGTNPDLSQKQVRCWDYSERDTEWCPIVDQSGDGACGGSPTP